MNHKCNAFVVFVLNYYMKRLLILPLLFLFYFCSSQKVFEGKITYKGAVEGGDSVTKTHYFSPGKIRMEMSYDNDPSGYDSPVIGLLDSNIYYILYPASKVALRIIIDTTEIFETFACETLADELEICGFKCFAIKDSLKVAAGLINVNISNTTVATLWYTKELYFPYDLTPYFNGYGIVYKNSICLSSVSDTKDSILGDERMTTTAIKVEYVKNPDSMFQIPNGYSVISGKMSEFLKDTGTKITVREIRTEELKQEEEEKPEPPPPPPPKKSKPLKSPAKKTKPTKPVKG